MLISAVRLVSLTGVPISTLNNWIGKKRIIPEVRGSLGRGNGHRFTLCQCIGIAVLYEIMETPRGCDTRYVTEVFNAFGDCPLSYVINNFKKGYTHFAGLQESGAYKPMLQPKVMKEWCDWPDVEKYYKLFEEEISKQK